MKLLNYKSIAVILTVVIFISIFLIISENHTLKDEISLNGLPSFGNLFEEEYMCQEGNSQLLKRNKGILFYLNIKFILFSIWILADLYKARHAEMIKTLLRFYSFCVFIVFFINKKDGKKGTFVCASIQQLN